MKLASFALLALLGSATPLSAQVTSIGSSSSGTVLANLSASDIGQTFTAPAQYLLSWTFFLRGVVDPPTTATAKLAAWDGAQIGPLLWSSNPFQLAVSNTEVPYTWTPNVSLLTGGQQYLFFVSFLDPARLSAGSPGTYLPGGIVSRSQTTNVWVSLLGADLRFDATFDRVPTSTVPEPATMGLLATGLAGIAAARRKQRSA